MSRLGKNEERTVHAQSQQGSISLALMGHVFISDSIVVAREKQMLRLSTFESGTYARFLSACNFLCSLGIE